MIKAEKLELDINGKAIGVNFVGKNLMEFKLSVSVEDGDTEIPLLEVAPFYPDTDTEDTAAYCVLAISSVPVLCSVRYILPGLSSYIANILLDKFISSDTSPVKCLRGFNGLQLQEDAESVFICSVHGKDGIGATEEIVKVSKDELTMSINLSSVRLHSNVFITPDYCHFVITLARALELPNEHPIIVAAIKAMTDQQK